MSPRRIIFAGTPDIAAEVLDTLAAAAPQLGYEVAAVLTRPDAALGRKRVLTASPVAQTAVEHGFPVIKSARVDSTISAQLAAVEADLGVVIAYGGLLPAEALSAPSRGWVNLHFSDLPAYRGASPVQHTILHRETETAVSIFQLTTGMDTGPVHARARHAVAEGVSSGELLGELTDIGQRLLLEVLPALLTGTSAAEPQQGTPSYAPKLTNSDAYIDPTLPAATIIATINATIPEPGAWSFYQDQRIKFGPVQLLNVSPQDAAAVGSVILVRHEDQNYAALVAGDGALVRLSQVQPAGKKPMAALDWLRGAGTTPILGERS